MMYLATCRYRMVASEKFLGCHVDVSYVCLSQALPCDFAVLYAPSILEQSLLSQLTLSRSGRWP